RWPVFVDHFMLGIVTALVRQIKNGEKRGRMAMLLSYSDMQQVQII
ncbi:hypothetical protein HMPREF1592_03069, partial [Escherichia coli 907357]